MSTTTQPEAEAQPTSLSLLAAKRFGNEFKGEVKTQEVQEEVLDEIIEDSEEAIPAEAEDSGMEAEEAEVETEAEGSEESEETPISSFSELVESQGWDPEWAKGLHLDVKINGEAGKAKLEDLINSYQIQGATEARLNEAKEKTQSLNQRQEELNEKFAVAAEILSDEKQTLDAEEAQLDSGNLDKVDPAEYSAKKLKLQQRRGKLDQKIQKATRAYQDTIQKNEAERNQSLQAHLAQEQTRLVEAIPEWSKPGVAEKEGAEIFQYLVKQGVPAEEASNIYDHRQVVMARKAMLYDQSRTKTDVAKKKVATIPKVLKPGASRSPEKANQSKIADAKNRLKRSGSIEDALAAMKAAKNS